MKLDFDVPNDGLVHEYCPEYHHETIEHRFDEKDRKYYYCLTCQKGYERRIKIDPGIVFHRAEDGEIWHESVGVFVRNPDNRFLFYTRTIFPHVMTIPSGHVDKDENHAVAAQRELKEEVNLEGKLLHIIDVDILRDQCSQGADAHHWHVYLLNVDPTPLIHVTKEEGRDPVWLTLDEALELDKDLKSKIAFPVRYLIERHREKLLIA